ncbi:MAG: Ldh family oxidoreductase [Alphaproteobacteria bacterium]|nr:Ldh family oxidoreductase [Alphaproteobacteria bacterium SS10]
MSLPVAEAEQLIVSALKSNNVSAANALSVARALVAAEIDGQAGHGFSRVQAYAAQAKSGKVDGQAQPIIDRPKPALLTIDAQHGFAFPAIDAVIDQLVEVAPTTGVAAALIRRSHHCGQLGAHVERLAEEGLVAIMVSNAPPAIAPWGGSQPFFGTNPIAFAAPRLGEMPLVIDLSISKVARGKVMAAAKQGKPIPEGWALDIDGHPTTDAEAALAGTMLPAGDAKGAMLALMVEILCATLTGANQSFEASSFFDAEGAPPGVGHTIIAFDPGGIATHDFGPKLEVLLTAMTEQDGVRLPGIGRADKRAKAKQQGVTIPAHLHQECLDLT